MQQKGGCILLIVLHMDDFLITSGSTVGLRDIKLALSKVFSMIDFGLLRKFIGLEVNKKPEGAMITRSRYI